MTKIIKEFADCDCGCKFSYEFSDINYKENLRKKLIAYVVCPKCKGEYYL